VKARPAARAKRVGSWNSLEMSAQPSIRPPAPLRDDDQARARHTDDEIERPRSARRLGRAGRPPRLIPFVIITHITAAEENSQGEREHRYPDVVDHDQPTLTTRASGGMCVHS
jgi:hypothetical protein